MVRAGLLVPTEILDAGERLATWFGLVARARWGMSPFGGEARHPVWEQVNPRRFLRGANDCAPAAAAFRVAYEVPQVSRMAVGASTAEHLAQLVATTPLDADHNRIAQYRSLLRARAVRTEAN